MKNSSPLVSVIMPVYNSEKYIKQAIDSILAQTYSNFELIIVDDKSSDSSLNIIDEYVQKDNRVKSVPNNKNTGQEYIYNKCISISSGEYIAIMHSDDISHPNRLDKQVYYLESHPNISILGTGFRFLDSDIQPELPLTNEQIKISLFEGNTITILHPSVMMRKMDLLRHNLFYTTGYLACEDYKLWVDAARKGLLINNMEEPLLQYRLHPNQLTSSKRDIQLEASDRIRAEYINSFCPNMLTKEDIEIIKNRYTGISSFRLYNLSKTLKKINKNNFFNKKDFSFFLNNGLIKKLKESLSKEQLIKEINLKEIRFNIWLLNIYVRKVANNLFQQK